MRLGEDPKPVSFPAIQIGNHLNRHLERYRRRGGICRPLRNMAAKRSALISAQASWAQLPW